VGKAGKGERAGVWQVYILECADGTFYTGITTDVDRRVAEHNGSVKGAKYTRPRRPVKAVYTREYGTKSEAAKEECRIKKISRNEKEKLIAKEKKEEPAVQ